MDSVDSQAEELGGTSEVRDPLRVADHSRCRGCGYNLTGLSTESRCPECGAAIWLSMRGALLRFSDPAWITKVVRGCLFMVIAVIGYFLCFCIGNYVSIPIVSGGMASFLDLAIDLAVSLVALIGVWLLTTGEPNEVAGKAEGGRSLPDARRLARGGQLAAVLGSLIALVAAVSPISVSYFVWLPVPLLLFTGVGFLATLVYVLRLSARLPAGNLPLQIRINLWGWSILFGLALLSVVLVVAARISSGGPLPGLRGGVAGIGGLGICVSFLGGLVFGVWSLIVLLRLQSQIGEERRIALGIWQAED